MTEVSVRLRFEAAHRLPMLPGKCQQLHGHSWVAWVTLAGAPEPGTGVVVDFSAVKHTLQRWVDEHLDHATLIGVGDPLAAVLTDMGLRSVLFGQVFADTPTAVPHLVDLAWPTVENVAELIRRVAVDLVGGLAVDMVPGLTDADTVRVARVQVAETENNQATAVTPAEGRDQ